MTTKIVIEGTDLQIHFHKEATINGLTHLIKPSEIVKLFKSISINHNNIRMKIEWLKPFESHDCVGITYHHKNEKYSVVGHIKLEVELK